MGQGVTQRTLEENSLHFLLQLKRSTSCSFSEISVFALINNASGRIYQDAVVFIGRLSKYIL